MKSCYQSPEEGHREAFSTSCMCLTVREAFSTSFMCLTSRSDVPPLRKPDAANGSGSFSDSVSHFASTILLSTAFNGILLVWVVVGAGGSVVQIEFVSKKVRK
jgi:hypothetical protein